MAADTDDIIKKAVKLPPIKKSGKEKHQIYSQLDPYDDEDEFDELYVKRESVLDYFDDDEEDL